MKTMSGRQRRRVAQLVRRVREAGEHGLEIRGRASERLARRACKVAGLVAVVSKSRPWTSYGRVLTIFPTLDMALRLYPRQAVMR